MKAYTAEDREALIEWLTPQIHELETACDEIPFGLGADDAMQLQVMRIALASLTAESITVRLFGAVGVDGSCWIECEEHEEGATQHYPAPPVPVMQPVELGSPLLMMWGRDQFTAYPASVVKDAIRAAGYEVQE